MFMSSLFDVDDLRVKNGEWGRLKKGGACLKGGAYWNRGAYLQKRIRRRALIRKGALIGRRALNRIITVFALVICNK